jgi:hypothetical protein
LGQVEVAEDAAAGTPAIASDGTGSLVTWTRRAVEGTAEDILGARVDRSGTVIGAPIPISTAPGTQAGPVVAFDGTRYLVAWTDWRGANAPDIYGARVGRSGVVRDPAGIPISTDPASESNPSIASNGRFFVVWNEQPDGYRYDVHGARVSGAGQVLDPGGVPIATSRTFEVNPAIIGAPGNRYTVAYQRYAPEAPYAADRVFLRRIMPK